MRQLVTLGKGGPLIQLLEEEMGLEQWLNKTQRLLTPLKKVNSVQLVLSKQAVCKTIVKTETKRYQS